MKEETVAQMLLIKSGKIAINNLFVISATVPFSVLVWASSFPLAQRACRSIFKVIYAGGLCKAHDQLRLAGPLIRLAGPLIRLAGPLIRLAGPLICTQFSFLS
jgi:hypothetical protein